MSVSLARALVRLMRERFNLRLIVPYVGRTSARAKRNESCLNDPAQDARATMRMHVRLTGSRA